jgi:pimeloyl-ACP methyl ester carboxylesterase
MFKMLVRLAARHPWQSVKCHLTWNSYALFETPSLAREAFFSADMPAETLNRYFARIQNESYCAGLEATFFKLPQLGKIGPLPMLVLGADNDALFSRDEVEATARAYKTQAEFFPNMAHAMMLEADWLKVAERILKWLREKGL